MSEVYGVQFYHLKPTMNEFPKSLSQKAILTSNLQKVTETKSLSVQVCSSAQRKTEKLLLYTSFSHNSNMCFVKGLLTCSFYVIHSLNQNSYKASRSKTLWDHFSFNSSPLAARGRLMQVTPLVPHHIKMEATLSTQLLKLSITSDLVGLLL